MRDDPGGAGGDDQHGGVPAPGGHLRRPPGHASGGAGRPTRARFPGGGWIAGRVWPYTGEVRVRQVWDAPARTRGRGAGRRASARPEVAFHTLAFPGWRAYVDGRRAPYRTPPVDRATRLGHGFVVVDVPPGAAHRRARPGQHPLAERPGRSWRSPAPPCWRCSPAGQRPAGVALRLMLAAGAAFALAGAFQLAADVRAASAPPWPLPGSRPPGAPGDRPRSVRRAAGRRRVAAA